MAKERYNLAEIVSRLRQAGILLGQGMAVAETVREIGTGKVPFCRWRKEGEFFQRIQRTKRCLALVRLVPGVRFTWQTYVCSGESRISIRSLASPMASSRSARTIRFALLP